MTSVAPSADWLAWMAAPVQPATGEAFGPFISERAPALKRACGGGLPRVSGQVLRAGNHAKHVRRAPCPGRAVRGNPDSPASGQSPSSGRSEAATACRMRTSSGEVRARARNAPPKLQNFRGAARARPSGPGSLSQTSGVFNARGCRCMPQPASFSRFSSPHCAPASGG